MNAISYILYNLCKSILDDNLDILDIYWLLPSNNITLQLFQAIGQIGNAGIIQRKTGKSPQPKNHMLLIGIINHLIFF